MYLLNVVYCNTCNKQFKGKVGLAKHRRRMQAVAYNQEATESHIANHANQTKPRWTDGEWPRLRLTSSLRKQISDGFLSTMR